MQNINLIEKYDLVQDSKFNTRVLAWLLNPYADHNLGDTFLDDFLFLIGERLNKNSNIKIEICHRMDVFGVIDILIETKDSYYAIQCGGEADRVWKYENYIKRYLNSDKKIVSVCIGMSPLHYIGEYEYIKYLMFSELAEIMPDNLTSENQQIVNQTPMQFRKKLSKLYAQNIQKTT